MLCSVKTDGKFMSELEKILPEAVVRNVSCFRIVHFDNFHFHFKDVMRLLVLFINIMRLFSFIRSVK